MLTLQSGEKFAKHLKISSGFFFLLGTEIIVHHFPLECSPLPEAILGLYLRLLQMINFVQQWENSQGLSIHCTAVMGFLPFHVDITWCLIKHNQNYNHTVISEGPRLKGTQYYTL